MLLSLEERKRRRDNGMFLFLQQTNLLLVVLVFLASLALLSKATDILVGNAV
jgi:predicted nucleic acid-binding Zn ribbon protein